MAKFSFLQVRNSKEDETPALKNDNREKIIRLSKERYGRKA